MRRFVWLLLVWSPVSLTLPGQPVDGDLVIATSTVGGYGLTLYLNPASPGTLTTLAGPDAADLHTWVRMAPNNTDLVIARGVVRHTWPGRGDLVNVSPGGALATLATFSVLRPEGFELDHDGRWVVLANKPPKTGYPPIPASCDVLGVRQTGGSSVQRIVWVNGNYNEVVIDRDPGPWQQSPLVIVTGTSIFPLPTVFRILGPGSVSTLTTIPFTTVNYSIEVHPRSGDYLVTGWSGVHRLTKSGSGLTTLLANVPATDLKVTQSDEAWIARSEKVSGKSVSLYKFDLSQNAVTTILPVNLPHTGYIESLEVYGSRRLVCYQAVEKPRTVTVNVQSRRPGDAGKLYVLACSLGRRPGIQFPGGLSLDLDVTHPLFFTSVLGLAPSIFKNFQGTTDALGNAAATVNIPAAVPPSLGLPVFVAGVICDSTGVRTVTNTHWFVLN